MLRVYCYATYNAVSYTSCHIGILNLQRIIILVTLAGTMEFDKLVK